MRNLMLIASVFVWQLVSAGGRAISADNPLVAEPAVAGPTKDMPIMIDVTDREPPTAEEWKSLHLETNRGVFGDGGIGDFSSKHIRVNGTRYWTATETRSPGLRSDP